MWIKAHFSFHFVTCMLLAIRRSSEGVLPKNRHMNHVVSYVCATDNYLALTFTFCLNVMTASSVDVAEGGIITCIGAADSAI